MTLDQALEKYGNEFYGLLLHVFAEDHAWNDESPVALAKRGLAMKQSMIQGRALLARFYHDVKKEARNDQANGFDPGTAEATPPVRP